MGNFLTSLLNYFKSEEGKKALLSFYYQKLVQSLKDKIKSLILKTLKHELMGGFKAKIIFFMVEHFVDDVIIPLAQYMKRTGVQHYYTEDGKSLILKLEKAKADGNQTDYDATVDDIFN